MRNSNPVIRLRPAFSLSHLCSAIAFIVVACWCQQSQASTNLWLWGWLGVSEIQIMQDPVNNSAAKDGALNAAKPSSAPAKNQVSDPIKKSVGVTKTMPTDDARGKDTKDRPLKITIM